MRAPPALAMLSGLALALALAACSLGCGTGSTTSSTSTTTSSSTTTPTAAGEACSPAKLGLGEAKPVTPWKLPAECKLRHGNQGLTFARTAEELGAQLDCANGSAGIDLTKHALAVARRMMSPAQVGTNVVDDGKTLTFLLRTRNPCPNDPRPMPTPETILFLVPAGGERAVKDLSCMVPSSCK